MILYTHRPATNMDAEHSIPSFDLLLSISLKLIRVITSELQSNAPVPVEILDFPSQGSQAKVKQTESSFADHYST